MATHCAVDQFDLEGNFVKSWASMHSACSALGTTTANIFRALDCSTRSEGGYRWRTGLKQRAVGEINYSVNHEYTDADRAEFSRRVPVYMPVVYNLIKPLSFVTADNADDYIQEALISCWKNYHNYIPTASDGQRFGAWFKVTSRWGIFGYYNYTKRWKIQELSEHHSEIVEEDNAVARAIALYHCIEELDEPHRNILTEWLNDQSPRQICEKLKISDNMYYKKFMHAKNVLRERFNVHYYGLQQSKVRLFRNVGSTPVEQYDMMGNFVARFPSMESTREMGFNPDSVSAVINARVRSHAGFFWKIADDRQRQRIFDAKQN